MKLSWGKLFINKIAFYVKLGSVYDFSLLPMILKLNSSNLKCKDITTQKSFSFLLELADVLSGQQKESETCQVK